MKVIILFAVFVMAAAKVEYYTVNDNLDVEEVVSKTEKLKSFIYCYLDKAPCTELAATYKKLIPEALATKCEKCNDKLKHLAYRFLIGFRKVFPQEFANFRIKFDPENKYLDDFEKAVERY